MAVSPARCRLLPLAAAILLAASGCGEESASQQASPAASPTASTAEAAQEVDAGIAQRLDGAINQAMTAANVPGAIVGVWSPEGSYIRSFGVADTATDTPMKTDFYSRIGSVTKTFTVTGVLQLADQGKLGLDDPIAEFIDGVPQGDKITLRQLARMQSGLFNYTDVNEFPGRAFRRPASSLHSRKNCWAGRSLSPISSRPVKDSSTATPTPFCWVSSWRRSADNHYTTIFVTTSRRH